MKFSRLCTAPFVFVLFAKLPTMANGLSGDWTTFLALIRLIVCFFSPPLSMCDPNPTCDSAAEATVTLTIEWVDMPDEWTPILVRVHDDKSSGSPTLHFIEFFGLQSEGTTVTRTVCLENNGCYELSFDNHNGIGRTELVYIIDWNDVVEKRFDGEYFDFWTSDSFGTSCS